MKMNTEEPKPMEHRKGSPEREVHSNTGLPKKHRNISNKQPNPTSTRTGGKETKPRESRRNEITKIRAELNDIKTKRAIQRINKSRSWFSKMISKVHEQTLS